MNYDILSLSFCFTLILILPPFFFTVICILTPFFTFLFYSYLYPSPYLFYRYLYPFPFLYFSVLLLSLFFPFSLSFCFTVICILLFYGKDKSRSRIIHVRHVVLYTSVQLSILILRRT